MKKKLLSGIVAVALGILTVAPVATYAAEDTTSDVNRDGVVDILDYTLLRHAVETKGQIENGKYVSFVRGDLNGNGKLDQGDLDILKTYGDEGVVIDETLADVNCDGTVDILDYTLLRKAINNRGELMADGHMQSFVEGDLDGNGAIDQDDLDLLRGDI